MLKRIPTDGAFLVRPSERESNCYAISFRYVSFLSISRVFIIIYDCIIASCVDTIILLLCRAEKKIKHCKIKLEGRLYSTGTVQFESLVELVNYYERHPLYKKIKLSHPVNQDIIRRMGLVCI